MKHIVSRMSSYFPNRWPLSYLNLTKIMKIYIRRQQHKKKFKHQDIKQKEPPQKYRLGTISNTKLLAGLNRLTLRARSECKRLCSPLRFHGDSTAFIAISLRLRHAHKQHFARRFNADQGARVEHLPRLQGVFTAFIALVWSFYRVQWRFYDKNTKMTNKMILNMTKQTK